MINIKPIYISPRTFHKKKKKKLLTVHEKDTFLPQGPFHIIYKYAQGRIQGDAQGARATPLISILIIVQQIILYTINSPVSDMLFSAPSTPKYIPLPITRAGVWDASLAPLTD